ncbi:MAG: baseplate J/gp47 family protein [Candidatus Scalindua sp.]
MTQIIDRISADFQTRITGATTLLRRSFLKVLAKVYGGTVHLLYGYLDYQSKQLFATTADTVGLDLIASEYGISRTTAVKATGQTVATGTDEYNIPANTELQSTNGQVYLVDTLVTLANGTATLDITAKEVGVDGNDDGNIILTFVSPIININSNTTVTSDGINGGSDEETDMALRERVLARKRKPPYGGAEHDYIAWAKEVAGITRTWAISSYMGSGTIGVAFVRDNDENILPNQILRDAMKAYIISHVDPASGDTIGCPVTAEPGLFIINLSELLINFVIDIYPNTDVVQTAIQTELTNLIKDEGGPGQTLYLSHINEVISQTAGALRHNLITPSSDITATNDQIHILGSITFGIY